MFASDGSSVEEVASSDNFSEATGVAPPFGWIGNIREVLTLGSEVRRDRDGTSLRLPTVVRRFRTSSLAAGCAVSAGQRKTRWHGTPDIIVEEARASRKPATTNLKRWNCR